ncbi:MAG: hypothetical protein PHX62_02075 [Bacilli bacterium]|nr:hypothetical protein [Bacilli bacterium]
MLFYTIQEGIKYAWQGLLAVFIGITIIFLVILLFNLIQKLNKKNQK